MFSGGSKTPLAKPSQIEKTANTVRIITKNRRYCIFKILTSTNTCTPGEQRAVLKTDAYARRAEDNLHIKV